ncbi:MAG: Rossmann-like and DUF2520 domain-containing protein [Ignavibacteriaceae bacterium]
MSKIKFNIAIIGAGKIAFSLTKSLINSGYLISIVVSRRVSSAKILADKFNIHKYSDNLQDLPLSCNVFFLCVPDSQLKLISKELSVIKFNFPKSIFIQLSGAYTAKVLTALDKKKAMTASFHIMQTFPSKKIVSLSKIYVAIETKNHRAEEILLSLAGELNLIAIKLESRNKIFYHLAAVFASNFLVGNYFSSQMLFKNAKMQEADFNKIITPIISSTVSNIKKFGAFESLSGPVERGELQIIKDHLNALEKNIHTTGIKVEALNYITQSLTLINLIEQRNDGLSDSQNRIYEFLLKKLKDISSKI